MKKGTILKLTICLAIIMSFFVTNNAVVFAEESEKEPITYIERSWDGSKVVENKVTITDYYDVTSKTYTFNGKKPYVAKGDVVIKGRIDSGDNTKLILTDDCKLEVTQGINAANLCTLQIYGQDNNSGELIANKNGENQYAAGIGGHQYCKNATIEIHGGNIRAYSTSKSWAAAIGGGSYGEDGYEIVIYGGRVTASSSYGTAIGFGHASKGDTNITVYGGSVNAAAGGGVAAINSTSLKVAGGTVIANTTWEKPAIETNNTVITGGSLAGFTTSSGTAIKGNTTLDGGILSAISTSSGTALSGNVNVISGELTAVSNNGGKLSDATITRGENIIMGYATADDYYMTVLPKEDNTIPSKAIYLKITDNVDSVVTGSTFSEGSTKIIIGASALIVGILIGLFFGKIVNKSKKA